MNEKLNVSLIADYIDINKLTKKEFCRQCKISTSTFYRIMRGEDFGILSLFKIAKKMNLPAYKFFE